MGTLDLKDEKRFAVVMYGGVSLAIYMYGVALELFRLVQSTAHRDDGIALKGSANVYRDIADRLKTQFVVDILSGTSAGGINAIFLAKALANGEDFENLESVWLNTGDILKLINDGRGRNWKARLAQLKKGGTPESLLDGRLMQDALLKALEQMDSVKKEDGVVADALDLFVTATDLQGVIAPLELSNGCVYERHHRQVFHFRKGPAGTEGNNKIPRNDLQKKNNGFIAFAARCTSSFPMAFTPVRLEEYSPPDSDWRRFCKLFPLNGAPSPAENFLKRSFADGGYLDNKPFTYATEAITERHTDLPVDRKLIYIEPSPELLTDGPEKAEEPPDAIDNTVRAFTLARYETIQQDILLIRQRNRLIERAKLILRGTEQDLQHMPADQQPPTLRNWLGMEMDKMIQEHGFAFGGYFRLRVARLTDDLAEIVARHLAIDINLDEFVAIRSLIRAWREDHYHYYSSPKDRTGSDGSAKIGFAHFLMDYDLSFPTRRLGFVVTIIDYLLSDEDEGARILEAREVDLGLLTNNGFRSRLRHLRKQISGSRKRMLELKDGLRNPPPVARTSDISRAVADLAINPKSLVACLVSPNNPALQAKESLQIVLDKSKEFAAFFAVVKERTRQAKAITDHCKKLLGMPKDEENPRWEDKQPEDICDKADWIVRFYFRFFPHYDSVSLPILQTPDLGEEIDEVKVVRISPASSVSLGGSKLANFGAFFDRTWRKNDILRGRLDGASGIISALLPGEANGKAREDLVHEAHEKIVAEWLENPSARKDLIAQVMSGATEEERQRVAEALGLRDGSGGSILSAEPVLRAISGNVTAHQFLLHFQNFTVDQAPRPELLAEALPRLARVGGQVMKGIAEGYQSQKGARIFQMVSQVGAFAVSLADVLIPGTWRYVFFRRPLELTMLFAITLLLGGMLLKVDGLGQFGVILLVISLVLGFTRLMISPVLNRKGLKGIRIFIGILILALAALGVLYLPRAINDMLSWFFSRK